MPPAFALRFTALAPRDALRGSHSSHRVRALDDPESSTASTTPFASSFDVADGDFSRPAPKPGDGSGPENAALAALDDPLADETRCLEPSNRGTVLGATNPADAEPSSIRAKMLAQHEALGMEEAPNNSNNGVHASASPLEALKERLIWLNFTLDSDPTGSKLVELAVWDESKRPVLDSLLENPPVDVAGMKGKAFDILEDKDTPDLYVLANNVAFAKELEGVC